MSLTDPQAAVPETPSAPSTEVALPEVDHLLLYDGVCGLCDRLVQFLLAIDRRGIFRFAPLQGELAAELRRRGWVPQGLDTFVYVRGLAGGAAHSEAGPPESLVRSDAAIAALAAVGGSWRSLALLRVVPRPLRDAVYRLVARSRYRIFGRFESCKLPSPDVRARFFD